MPFGTLLVTDSLAGMRKKHMVVRTRKFGKPNGSGDYIVREFDDFEYVNPEHQIMHTFSSSSMWFDRHNLKMNGLEVPEELIDKVLFKRAIKEWQNQLEKFKSVEIPKNLLELLEADRKKRSSQAA